MQYDPRSGAGGGAIRLLLAWIGGVINVAGRTGSRVEQHAAVLDGVRLRSPQRPDEAGALRKLPPERRLDCLTEGEVADGICPAWVDWFDGLEPVVDSPDGSGQPCFGRRRRRWLRAVGGRS